MSKVLNMSSLLEEHYKYLKGLGGKRLSLSGHDLSNANLRYADLKYADLSNTNLRNADLSNADLTDACLNSADLRNADLRSANLKRADLSNADLINADLINADLSNADLSNADLTNACLTNAYLDNADLINADLTDADLTNADLTDSYLDNADLTDTELPNFLVCPEVGEFVAYKKLSFGVVVSVLVTGKRTNSLVGRKCRTSELKVIDVVDNPYGRNLAVKENAIRSTHYGEAVYYVGATISEKEYDDDIRVECTKGIHFFMTLKEAKNWG